MVLTNEIITLFLVIPFPFCCRSDSKLGFLELPKSGLKLVKLVADFGCVFQLFLYDKNRRPTSKNRCSILRNRK